MKKRRPRPVKIPLGLEHRAVEITGDPNARIPPERMSRYKPVQPLGYRCPKCGHTEVNPEARHVRQPDGSTEFRNIVQAVELIDCETCRDVPTTTEP